MRENGAETYVAKRFGLGRIDVEEAGGVGLGMDGLVPVIGAPGAGGQLSGSPEKIEWIAGGSAFGRGNAIVGIEIDKRRVDVFSATIYDDGIFGRCNAGPGVNDQSVADDQGGVFDGRAAVFNEC